jgi:hypothetical protein
VSGLARLARESGIVEPVLVELLAKQGLTFWGGALPSPAGPTTLQVISQSPSAVIWGTNFACPPLVSAARCTGVSPDGVASPVVVGTASNDTLLRSAIG